jgi:hypothetical protein
MGKHGNTSGKTSRISRTTGMSLSLRVNIALQGKQCGLESFGTNPTLWPKMCAWINRLGNIVKLRLVIGEPIMLSAKDLGFQSNTIYYESRMATTICMLSIPSMTSLEKGWAKMCKSTTSSRKSWGLAQPFDIKECDTLRWNIAEAA